VCQGKHEKYEQYLQTGKRKNNKNQTKEITASHSPTLQGD